MNKIFQIGFNKCGTTSLHNFFKRNGIKSIHWDNGDLAKKIYENHKLSRRLLSGYEEYDAFTDMEMVGDNIDMEVPVDLFSYLYQEYPRALFIFNDRSPQEWINSRMNHNKGKYAESAMKRLNMNSLDELKGYWLKRYDMHKNRVLSHFEGKKNFVHFYIDKDDSITHLLYALRQNEFIINNESFPHSNKNRGGKGSDIFHPENANVFRDTALFYENKDLKKALHLMEVAHHIRPNGKFIIKKIKEYRNQLK